MQSKKLLLVILFLSLILGIFIPCQFEPRFKSTEKWIPKEGIVQTISSFQQIRLIQLVNWPSIKHQLMHSYPMIEDLSLSFNLFPKIIINIKEKQPWAILIQNHSQKVFSNDGILLNHKMADVELPNTPILMINSEIDILKDNQIMSTYLNPLRILQEELKEMPLFQLQQIKITSRNIALLNETGLYVNLGNLRNINQKVSAFKYFLASNNAQNNSFDFIDVQFPKRVIIR